MLRIILDVQLVEVVEDMTLVILYVIFIPDSILAQPLQHTAPAVATGDYWIVTVTVFRLSMYIRRQEKPM